MVVASVFLLASDDLCTGKRGSTDGHGDAAMTAMTAEAMNDHVGAAAEAAAMASVCADGAELVAYLEVMLESSILCAVWEVSHAVPLGWVVLLFVSCCDLLLFSGCLYPYCWSRMFQEWPFAVTYPCALFLPSLDPRLLKGTKQRLRLL